MQPMWNQEALAYGLRTTAAILPFYVPFIVAPWLPPFILTGLLWGMISVALLTQTTLGMVTKRSVDVSTGLIVGTTIGMAINWTGSVAAKLVVAAAVLLLCPIFDFALLPPGRSFGKLMAIGYVVVVFQCFCQSSDERGILLLWCAVTVGFLSGCLSCVMVWTFILPSYASDKAIDEIKYGLKSLTTLHEHTWIEWEELNRPGNGTDTAWERELEEERAEKLAEEEAESVKAREAVATSLFTLQGFLDQAEWEVPVAGMGGRQAYVPHFIHDFYQLVSKLFCCKGEDGSVKQEMVGMPILFNNEQFKSMLTSFSQMSRAIWAHHLALRQSAGMNVEEVAALRRSYPPGFLDALRLSMKAFLEDLYEAIPDYEKGGSPVARKIPLINLKVFEENVDIWVDIARQGHEQAVRRALSSRADADASAEGGSPSPRSPKLIESEARSFSLFLHWTAAHHTALVMCKEGDRLRGEFHNLFRVCSKASKEAVESERGDLEAPAVIHIHVQEEEEENKEAVETKEKMDSRWWRFELPTIDVTLLAAIQSGIRLAGTCLIVLGPLLSLSDEIIHTHFGLNLYLAIFWCAITTIVLISNLTGTASSSGGQRAVGTIIGGALALAVGISENSAVIVIVGLVVFAIGGYYGVVLTKADYGARLLVITYLIVASEISKGKDQLVTTFVSRVCGVLAGILLTFLGSIFIFPRSATSKVLGELHKMTAAAKDLLSSTWLASGLISTSYPEGKDCSEAREEALASHLAFNSAYKALKANKTIADDESFIGHLWGKRILIPSWLVLHRIPAFIPDKELLEVAKAVGSLRQTTIALSLAFLDGFKKESSSIILGRYPHGLIEAIRVLSEAFVDDLNHSLPDEHGHFSDVRQEVPKSNLERLQRCLEVLCAISESQYLSQYSKIHSRQESSPYLSCMSPVLIRVGITVDHGEGDGGKGNPWLCDDTFPEWRDSEGACLVPKLDLSTILMPRTKEGFLDLMRWVSARLALSDFCDAAEELRDTANALLKKI